MLLSTSKLEKKLHNAKQVLFLLYTKLINTHICKTSVKTGKCQNVKLAQAWWHCINCA